MADENNSEALRGGSALESSAEQSTSDEVGHKPEDQERSGEAEKPTEIERSSPVEKSSEVEIQVQKSETENPPKEGETDEGGRNSEKRKSSDTKVQPTENEDRTMTAEEAELAAIPDEAQEVEDVFGAEEAPIPSREDTASEKEVKTIMEDVVASVIKIEETGHSSKVSLYPAKASELKVPTLQVSDEGLDTGVEVKLHHQVTPRSKDEDVINVTGDFKVKPQDGFISEDEEVDLEKRCTITSAEEAQPEEEEEEKVEEEEKPEESVEEEEFFDRTKAYEKYMKLFQDYSLARKKNAYLMRKMAEYYKKRRMDHVLKEGDNYEENLKKYHAKLDAFGELKSMEERERKAITEELNKLTEQRNTARDQLQKDFEEMQSRERHIGTGLTYAKTGKQIPDKTIERYLRTQRQKTNELSKLRVAYIKMRDKIQEKQAALDDLDKIGDNFHLIDYEQLKIENRNHADKIEERDEELGRLRGKCIAAIDCLAHIREKSAEIQLQIVEHNTLLDEAKMESWECRERVNFFKLERDTLRADIERLKEESGLLTKSRLLCDMEESMRERDETQQELDEVIKSYNKKKELISDLKETIEEIEAKIKFFGPMQKKPGVKKAGSSKGKSERKDPVEYSHINLH